MGFPQDFELTPEQERELDAAQEDIRRATAAWDPDGSKQRAQAEEDDASWAAWHAQHAGDADADADADDGEPG